MTLIYMLVYSLWGRIKWTYWQASHFYGASCHASFIFNLLTFGQSSYLVLILLTTESFKHVGDSYTYTPAKSKFWGRRNKKRGEERENWTHCPCLLCKVCLISLILSNNNSGELYCFHMLQSSVKVLLLKGTSLFYWLLGTEMTGPLY